MIAVALNHAIHTVVESRIPVFLIGKFLIFRIKDTVTFYVSLAHYVKSVFIAQLIPFRIVGIMRSTHGIDGELLHHLHISRHIFYGKCSAMHGIVFLTVNTLKGKRYAINQNLSVLHFYYTKSERLSHTFLYFSVLICSIDDERI